MEQISQISHAITKRNEYEVRKLFPNFILNNPESWKEISYDFLCKSLELNQTGISQFLIKEGCLVNIPNSEQNTPLHIAVQKKNLVMVSKLLLRNANVTAHSAQNENYSSPLQLALEQRSLKIISLIVKHGINIEQFDKDKVLLFLVEEEMESEVNEYLDKGADVNIRDIYLHGTTALHIAASRGNLEIAKSLLKHRAVINSPLISGPQEGYTPLYLAVKYKRFDMVHLLLKNKASIEYRDMFDKQTALHIGAHKDYWNEKIFTELITHGANINSTDEDGNTPLHIAVENKNINAVKCILQHAPLKNIRNKELMTALHMAVLEQNITIIRLLLDNKADVDIRDKNSRSALHIAVEKNNKSAVECILEYAPDLELTNNKGQTALHVGVEARNVEITKLLLDNNADANTKDYDSKTPLHVAICNGDVAIVEDLLKKNANINIYIRDKFYDYDYDYRQMKALFYATQSGHRDVIQKLLEFNADINETNYDGDTILDLAFRLRKLDVIEVILQNKPKINHNGRRDFLVNVMPAFEKQFETYSGFITNLHKLLDILVDNGLNFSTEETNNEALLKIAIEKHCFKIFESILTQDISTEAKNNALFVAIHNYNQMSYDAADTIMDKVIELLIDKGADFNAQHVDNKSVLFHAVMRSVKCVETLFKKGASVNMTNSTELLTVAVSHCKLPMIRLLMQNGADIKAAIAQKGEALISNAVSRGHYHFAELLWKNGAPINVCNADGQTLLHVAANKCVKTVDKLIKLGIDVNAVDNQGNTALHLTAQNKTRSNTTACIAQHTSCLLDIRNQNQDTPLLIATRCYNLNVVNILLFHGANIEIKDRMMNNALHLASHGNNSNLIKLILDRTPLIDSKVEGKTPLDIILSKSNMNSLRLVEYYKHIIQRKCVNMCVYDSEVDVTIYDILSKAKYNKLKVLIEFKNECAKEVEKMKRIHINHSNISYYDFLNKNVHQIVSLFSNESISESISFGEIRDQFPIYAQMIEGRVQIGKTRKQLLTQIEAHAHVLIPQLPYYCILHLLGYLDCGDLAVLVDSMWT